jgi:methylamine---glutamate N-methyltransferase subunit A
VCGIAGFFYKDAESTGALGRTLVDMCQEMYRRGTDSVGFALYGAPSDGGFVLRVQLEGGVPAGTDEAVVAVARQLVEVRDAKFTGPNVRLVVDSDLGGTLADSIESGVPGARVFSVGRSMEVIKDLGSAEDVDAVYHVSLFEGTHGIGHTRMATESQVDIAHSHPFWARPFPDIAVVHNGTITNYHKLRRLLENKGRQFATHNDSEVIAVYLADKLESGESLESALRSSVSDLDGTFAYLVSTKEGIGLARDQFATKPLLYAEDEELVVLASEECAIRRVLRDPRLQPRELQAKEVRWWVN